MRKPSAVRKILIVRPDALGDIILTLPLLMALKKALPHVEVYYLCSTYTAPLLLVHPEVSGIIIDDYYKSKKRSDYWALLAQLKKRQFDVSIHCYNELDHALLTWIAGIPMRIGDRLKVGPNLFYSHSIPQGFRNFFCHELDLNMQLLAPLDVPILQKPEYGLESLTLPDFEVKNLPTDYLIVHPGMGRGNGNIIWPLERFRELISRLSGEGYNIVVTGGGSAEATRNEKICNKLVNVINLTNQTGLLDLVKLIQKARAFISVDTGPMHIAAALKIPVVLLSPTKYIKPNRWAPYGFHRIVTPRIPCLKICYPFKCVSSDCIEGLWVEDVVSAVQNVLSELHPETVDFKLEMLRVSLNILNLSSSELTQELSGFKIYCRQDMDRSFIPFVWTHDINVVIKDKVNL
ncbi:MAG: glycosyltransferase family 9 protein, partial [Candidatus Margulisiibacteriota bacterium]